MNRNKSVFFILCLTYTGENDLHSEGEEVIMDFFTRINCVVPQVKLVELYSHREKPL